MIFIASLLDMNSLLCTLLAYLKRVEAGPKPWPPEFLIDVLPRICASMRETNEGRGNSHSH